MHSRLQRSASRRGLLALGASLLMATPALAQQGKVFTAADYDQARALGTPSPAITALANTGRVTANWLPDGKFWYRDSSSAGVKYVLVDPVKKTQAKWTGDTTPIPNAAGGGGGRGGRGAAGGRGGRGNAAPPVTPPPVAGQAAAAPPPAGRGGRGGGGATSADGKTAFIKDFNLWVRDASGRETQLTTDGVKDFGYATENAGWTSGPGPVMVWSPDGTKIATQQQDERGVGKMYLVSTPTGGQFGAVANHPVLREWNYPLPGDSIITTIQRVIIDVPNKKVIRLQMPADQHRSIQGDNLSMSDVKWAPDGSRIVFASVSRDHKHVWVREANAATGAVRQIFDEASPTHIQNWAGGWQVLWKTNEILWYSLKDGYGHLYLYDLATGKEKNKITNGPGNVVGVTRLNDTTRTLWYAAQGGEAGQNAYFSHHYRVNLDGTHQVALNPDNGNHDLPAYSPDGKYFIDVWSQTDVPPASALRDANTGALIMPLKSAVDVAQLKALGWLPVTVTKTKGRDGTTDVYGQMWKPANFDASKKYPIINYIYPGPQTGSVSGWGFKPGSGDNQQLANLGFIVVSINGMGTPGRDQKFMDAYYGNMGDNTLPDQVNGMKELARMYPWIDIDKVGIHGHSGGGFATADAMFRYPDFFKVGIAESGNHDNRQYEDDWGERYQGLLTRKADGTTNYDDQANENMAKNLKGHLLLAHGTMDNNVPPYNTLLIVDQLIKNNKDFDLLLIPNSGHGYGTASSYMQRRRWDYFVRWLLNAEPPKEYNMDAGGRGGRGRGGPPAGGGGN